MRKSVFTAATAALVAVTAGQNCISLSGSTACPAFSAASISTDSQLSGLYPFLRYVSNVQEFDQQLTQFVSQGYVAEHYGTLFGCSNIDLTNTSNYYARFTNSFLCNGIVQNSAGACGLSGTSARALCADSCADFARSEAVIISSNQLCSPRSANYDSQLRADFTNCALPADSLTTTCIPAIENESANCGFGNNLMGLCDYCRGSTVNATDTCCYTSNSESRCQNVVLPSFSAIPVDFTSTATGSPSATSTGASSGSSSGSSTGLSGGAIAGIVIGSILGALLLLALIIGLCILARRRRREAGTGNFLNQPSPQRKGVSSGSYVAPSTSQQGYEVLPGGRVARMAALSGDDAGDETATSDVYGDSPGSHEKAEGMIGALKLERSPGNDELNDSSNEYSSPEGVASGQSEQLPFFKDYYSNDDIHPGDKVSVLWAYQPRAGDEFELERGDMLKVIGIWDDGWATGVRINDRAEDYEGKHKLQRDSGVSNNTHRREETTPPPPGEIKAFPLVCICLPEAWKKTVEGDTSTEGSGPPTA